jgi:poly(hydroxyalkanoate) depolymerase family esterase
MPVKRCVRHWRTGFSEVSRRYRKLPLKKFRNPFDLLKQHRSPSILSTQGVDVRAITHTINDALASAGLTTQSGVGRTVNDTIHRAFASAGLSAAPSALPGDADTSNVVPLFPRAAGGEFVTRSFSCAAGSRTYKLYIPASYAAASDERVPLVVMLHGCTQDPDDFAAGTRMNTLADRDGFLVAYPAQGAQANVSKCWNWFRAQDQARDSGEPALIAGITREVATNYRIDEHRIFVAGLSAGAAMAVVLGETYPELYAAVGVHSGLPYASAHDVASAFAAMHGSGSAAIRVRNAGDKAALVPTIVFHGDSDTTVNPANADAIVAQTRAALPEGSDLRVAVSQGVTPGGRAYTQTVLADGANQPVIEQWVLHGAGHAWSGGDAAGSFTDASGPDASAEMIRFFWSQRRPGNA